MTQSIENLLNQNSCGNKKRVELSYTSYQDKTMESFDIFFSFKYRVIHLYDYVLRDVLICFCKYAHLD